MLFLRCITLALCLLLSNFAHAVFLSEGESVAYSFSAPDFFNGGTSDNSVGASYSINIASTNALRFDFVFDSITGQYQIVSKAPIFSDDQKFLPGEFLKVEVLDGGVESGVPEQIYEGSGSGGVSAFGTATFSAFFLDLNGNQTTHLINPWGDFEGAIRLTMVAGNAEISGLSIRVDDGASAAYTTNLIASVPLPASYLLFASALISVRSIRKTQRAQ